MLGLHSPGWYQHLIHEHGQIPIFDDIHNSTPLFFGSCWSRLHFVVCTQFSLVGLPGFSRNGLSVFCFGRNFIGIGKGIQKRGLSFSSVGKKKGTMCKVCCKSFKPQLLFSEKLAFGGTLFSNMESDTGIIQKTIIASFATCCCTSYR